MTNAGFTHMDIFFNFALDYSSLKVFSNMTNVLEKEI